jgi:nitrogen fixation NifU-like protein
MTDLRELYEEVLLDHNRHPRNYPRRPPDSNRHARGYNPVCGDEFTVYLTVEDGRIKDVGFEGAGCAISTASASLMTESIMGKTEQEAETLFHAMHRLLTEENETPPEVGKLAVLAGVQAFPNRVKCATLAWHTLHGALAGSDEVTTE